MSAEAVNIVWLKRDLRSHTLCKSGQESHKTLM